jgi:hypothetical protein
MSTRKLKDPARYGVAVIQTLGRDVANLRQVVAGGGHAKHSRLRALYDVPDQDVDLWLCGAVVSNPDYPGNVTAAVWPTLRKVQGITALPGYWRALCDLLYGHFGEEWFTKSAAARVMCRGAGKLRWLAEPHPHPPNGKRERVLHEIFPYRLEREPSGKRRFRIFRADQT